MIARAIDLLLVFLLQALGAGLAILTAAVVAGLVDAGPAFHAALERLSAAVSAGRAVGLRERAFEWLGAASAIMAMHSLCEGLHGATLGKRLLGITVVGEDLRPARLAAGFKRTVGFLVDQMFLGLVGIHRMHGSPRCQRIGDEWAGTVVVRGRALEPGSRRSRRRFAAVALAGVWAAGATGFLLTLLHLEVLAIDAAQDRVRIVSVTGHVVRVEYSLLSAASGKLRLGALVDEEFSPQGEAAVSEGARTRSFDLSVKLPPRTPGYPDRTVQLVAALFPGGNEDQPSAVDRSDLDAGGASGSVSAKSGTPRR